MAFFKPALPRAIGTLALLPILAWSGVVGAQTANDQKAEALFREGRAAVDRGDYATGCARFTASVELTRRAGPLLNLASCDEHQGHLVAALADWAAGIALLPAGDERVAISRQRAGALDRRVPRLTLQLAPGVPPGARVVLDGAEVSRAALGVPQPMDLGEHVVVAVAAGHVEVRSAITLAEGERRSLAVAPGPALAADGAPEAEAGSGRRTAGFVLGGVGVAGVAVGAITGIVTLGKKSTTTAHCTKTACDQVGFDAESAGKTSGTISTVTFLVGGAALAAGVTLVLVSRPRRAPTTATVAPLALPGGGGLLLGGTF